MDQSMKEKKALYENLVNTRFGHFIVAFSICLVAIGYSHTINSTRLITFVSTGLLIMLAVPIARAQQKLNVVIDEFEKTEPDAAINLIEAKLKERSIRIPPARNLVGYWTPLYAIVVMFVIFILSFIPCLRGWFET